MKKTALQKWCDGTWLYAVYFLGVMMACVLIWNWAVWETPQKLLSIRVKSQRFAFTDKGYFDKYESD